MWQKGGIVSAHMTGMHAYGYWLKDMTRYGSYAISMILEMMSFKNLLTRLIPKSRSSESSRLRKIQFMVFLTVIYARPNAHATISGNSFRQNAPPCDPVRSFMTTSAPASRSADAHLVAFSRKNGSCVPATRYVRGIRLGITSVGL